MAKHTMYSNIMQEIAEQGFNWASNAEIKCALLHSDNDTGDPWDQTNTIWGDISGFEVTEAATTGYTAGGQNLPAANNTITRTGRVTELKSTHDPKWENSTIDATHAVLYVDAAEAGDKLLISQIDFEATESSVDGDFEIAWTDAIVATITVAEKV